MLKGIKLFNRILTWTFVGSLAAIFIGLALAYLYIEVGYTIGLIGFIGLIVVAIVFVGSAFYNMFEKKI